MRFQDISTDTQTTYTLGQNENVVFFMLNRTGELTFELNKPGAEAFILSLFTGVADEKKLSVVQRHRAPKTTSCFVGKALVSGSAKFQYDGLISIEKNATGSDGSQDFRNLILSENASAVARPALEIKTDEVRCHHASTTSTLSKDALFFAESRGLSEDEARRLLTEGFAKTIVEAIPAEFTLEKQEMGDAVRILLKKLLTP